MKVITFSENCIFAVFWAAQCVTSMAQLPAEAQIPQGFHLRALQSSDRTLISQICPKVAWRSAFMCYRDARHRTTEPDQPWAEWVLQQEEISVPVKNRPRFKTAAGRELGWLPMTTGYLTLPDKSVYIVASSSSKYDEGQSICWLIDPAGKSVDIIWENLDRTTYMGPHSALFRQNKLRADFADNPPEAAPVK